MAKPRKPDTADPLARALVEADRLLDGDISTVRERRRSIVAALSIAIDTEAAKATTASGADLSRLFSASELMAKMVPALLTANSPDEAKSARFHGDPRARLVQIIMNAIERPPVDAAALRAKSSGPPAEQTSEADPPPSQAPTLRVVSDDPPKPDVAAPAPDTARDGAPDAPAELAEEPAVPNNVTPLKSARKTYHGPNGETWTEPGPNEPVQAKPGWLTAQQQADVNSRPSSVDGPRACDAAGGAAGFRIGLGVEPWREHVSGNDAFFWGGPSGRRSW